MGFLGPHTDMDTLCPWNSASKVTSYSGFLPHLGVAVFRPTYFFIFSVPTGPSLACVACLDCHFPLLPLVFSLEQDGQAAAYSGHLEKKSGLGGLIKKQPWLALLSGLSTGLRTERSPV